MTAAQPRSRTRFNIPVFPHVKKFILQKYRLSNPAKSEEINSFGEAVTKALRDHRLSAANDSQTRSRLTENITIVLTKDQSGFAPKLQKLIRINNSMDKVFKEDLLTWIIAQRLAGIPAHTACKLFLEYYSIDENEYSLEAAYKLWTRTKAKKILPG